MNIWYPNMDLQVTAIHSVLETPENRLNLWNEAAEIDRRRMAGGRETKSRRRNKMTTRKRVIDVVQLLFRPLPSEISNGSENA